MTLVFPLNFITYICTHSCMHSGASYVDILVCRTFFHLRGACCIQWLISRVLLHCYISTLRHTPSNFFILRVISGCRFWHCRISWVWFQVHFFKMGVGTCQLHINTVIICGDTSNISCQKVKRKKGKLYISSPACMLWKWIRALYIQYICTWGAGCCSGHTPDSDSVLSLDWETVKNSACVYHYSMQLLHVPSTHVHKHWHPKRYTRAYCIAIVPPTGVPWHITFNYWSKHQLGLVRYGSPTLTREGKIVKLCVHTSILRIHIRIALILMPASLQLTPISAF